ncbi:MAG: hypothetical protein QM813_18545 [Verrucomicrobiota bacterium]
MSQTQNENLLTETVGSGESQNRRTRAESNCLPIGYIPTPTREYRSYRKSMKATVGAGKPTLPIPIPIPIPVLQGSRVLMWKQDPSVSEIGIRKAYLPSRAVSGPRDSRISTVGLPPVSPNALGDLIQTPGTDAFDSVHTFAVVRQTLTMFQRAVSSFSSSSALPWAWNSSTNTDPLSVYPHGLPDTMNAYYSRSAKALKFGDFIRPGSSPAQRLYTCRSFDIVAHETGHAILDGLKPGWIMSSSTPQSGALHEAFGDLTAIFLALSQFDQVEAVIAQTRANLHDRTFLSDLAEEFGLALGRPNGLRNADNDLKLSQVSTEVHALSQVFTGGIYDVLADIFAFERKPMKTDDAVALFAVGQYLCGLLLRAIIAAPANNASFASVVNQMLAISAADGKPVQYRNFIRNRFTLREVVVSPTPLTADFKGATLEAAQHETLKGPQNRCGCCGTMQHADFNGDAEAIEEEIEALRKSFDSRGKSGRGMTPVASEEERTSRS